MSTRRGAFKSFFFTPKPSPRMALCQLSLDGATEHAQTEGAFKFVNSLMDNLTRKPYFSSQMLITDLSR